MVLTTELVCSLNFLSPDFRDDRVTDCDDSPLASIDGPCVVASPAPSCLSCFEMFDIWASFSLIEPAATSKILYGRLLSCPQSHPFCYPCLQRFARIELAKALQGETVFPIRCPVCISQDWNIGEDEAALFLNADDLREWVRLWSSYELLFFQRCFIQRRILGLESRPKVRSWFVPECGNNLLRSCCSSTARRDPVLS